MHAQNRPRLRFAQHINRLAFELALGMHFERQLAFDRIQKLDLHRLLLLARLRLPRANFRIVRSHSQYSLSDRHDELRLAQFSAQDLIGQIGVGMHEPVAERDLLQVRDCREQLHFGLLTGA